MEQLAHSAQSVEMLQHHSGQRGHLEGKSTKVRMTSSKGRGRRRKEDTGGAGYTNTGQQLMKRRRALFAESCMITYLSFLTASLIILLTVLDA